MALINCAECKIEISSDVSCCPGCGARNKLAEWVAPIANYEVSLLCIPAFATLLNLLWVSNMELVESPSFTLTLICLLTIIGTAVLVAAEAKAVGMIHDRKLGSRSPIEWLFGMLFLWFFAFPLYLSKRKQFNLKGHGVVGAILVLIFCGSYFLTNMIIAQKKIELKESSERLKSHIQTVEPILINKASSTYESSSGSMENVIKQVASDSAAQYIISKRSGTMIDACMRAGVAADAYLQANDEANYKKWKSTQVTDCAAVGVQIK